jgi:glucose/arabinose dehydrogenase
VGHGRFNVGNGRICHRIARNRAEEEEEIVRDCWTLALTRTAILVGVVVRAPGLVVAQDATPFATPDSPPEGITVVATGLENPRGFDWGPDGALFVALAGNDGTTTTASTSASPEDQVLGPTMSGQTASVVRIEDGCGVPVVTGLPSTRDPFGDVQGPVAVGFLDGQLYVLQDATGGFAAVGPDFPNGLYAANPDGSVRLISDLTTYLQAHPAEHLYHVLELGEPFAMVVAAGGFYVVDANQGLLLRIEPVGTISLVADVSLNHPVPTALAVAPDGGIYVGFLNSAPHQDGAAKVIKVSPDGTVSDYWTGLTMVTGLALTPDGTLYALDMATGNSETEPNVRPNTGRLVRQTGPASLEEVVTGLDFPISMATGPDGGLYVSLPAIATDGELGGILRIDPTIAGPVAMPTDLLADSPCAPVAPDAAVSPAVSPAATAPHTVTAGDGSFDSGNLDPGDSYVHACDEAGSFAYACSYPPNMTGTIVVQ